MKDRKAGPRILTASASAVRASISFPPDLYQTLEVIAKNKKVSLAWVVRDAAERYVAEEPARTAESLPNQRRRRNIA